MFPKSLVVLGLLALVRSAPVDVEVAGQASSDLVERDGCNYKLKGVGTFTRHIKFDFTKLAKWPNNLSVSEYMVGPSPDTSFAHYFNASNVVLNKGRPLRMTVPGGQTKGPIQSAEFTTTASDVLYASVRTVARASNVTGGVHGKSRRVRTLYPS